ncbi:uracil-DNA glycosylase [Solicola sp. PLA-1-18]|uniref:uracil-DNA glycosylase n=1 Tax=Solicola sp. PLA-1-18 TaxID=3380532 RepID=UPI003B7CFAF3
MAPLNALVERWRAGPPARTVPWFDPDGGGVDATVLLLMESPGPRTVEAGAGAITTEDNDDPTARRLHRLRVESGLPRERCVRWNVVPWALGRTPTVADLEEARPALADVVALLTRLRVVVPFGTAALNGWMRHLTLTTGAGVVPTLGVPHPSPANGHRRSESEARTVAALRTARGL